MCTVVILHRPNHRWPVLLAANRDEAKARPWTPPARHWPDRADVVAGRDETAGGTWLGINDYGVAAGVLNRPGTLGPATGQRSRGEVPLDALDHASAEDAVAALRHLDDSAYRPFNLVIADRRGVFVLTSEGDGQALAVQAVGAGLHMVTAHGLNSTESARTRTYRPRFKAACAPAPDAGDWDAWAALMAEESPDMPENGMNITRNDGFGTVSASLIALSADLDDGGPARWLFCAGKPGEKPYKPVDFGPPARPATL